MYAKKARDLETVQTEKVMHSYAAHLGTEMKLWEEMLKPARGSTTRRYITLHNGGKYTQATYEAKTAKPYTPITSVIIGDLLYVYDRAQNQVHIYDTHNKEMLAMVVREFSSSQQFRIEAHKDASSREHDYA